MLHIPNRLPANDPTKKILQKIYFAQKNKNTQDLHKYLPLSLKFLHFKVLKPETGKDMSLIQTK